MKRLGDRGHKVLFVDPPIRARKEIKQIFQGRWGLTRILTKTYKPHENIFVYTPTSSLPFWKRIDTLIDRSEKGKARNSILWVYHVEIENLETIVDAIPHDLLVYDCVDDYPSFPRYKTKEQKDWIIKREDWLAKKADIIFTSAPGLFKKHKKINKNTFYAPNAADFDMFAPAVRKGLKKPKDMENIPQPIIGFTGAIDDYKLNISLIEKSAKAYPEYSFVLIGPTKVADKNIDLTDLKSLDNIYFLGPKQHKYTPNYFSNFDVYIIPYNVNDYTVKGCYPVKFHEALAAGLPTVVTNLPCYKEFSGVSYIAKNDEEFIHFVKKALDENDNKKIKQRQKVARENTWDSKVDKQISIINKFIQ